MSTSLRTCKFNLEPSFRPPSTSNHLPLSTFYLHECTTVCDNFHCSGTILRLTIDGVAFSTQPPWSPVVAQVPVEARKESLVVVGVHGSDWVPDDQFMLTTKLD